MRQALKLSLVLTFLNSALRTPRSTFCIVAVMLLSLSANFAVASSIGLGGQHTIALKNDWTVAGCGNNFSGQLGDGTGGGILF